MFEKNLKLLEKVNKQLAKKVEKITLEEATQHVSVIKNENGEYILVRDNKFIDDTPSPTEAAKAIYQENVKSATSRHDFIIIFGLGLGNLLDYVHEKSMCNIILYEPDLNILRFTFEYVDLNKYFADGRIFVANNLIECSNYIEEKYLLDDIVEFVYLKNYILQHSSEFTVLADKIFDVCKSKIIDMNTTQKMSKAWTTNMLQYSRCKTNVYSINIFKNKFKGKTALVLGAGPSLKDNIEKIKSNRDNFVIFAVNRTIETLRQNDITPDFCVCVDAKWVKHTLPTDLDYLSNINLIADAKSDKYLNSIQFKNLITYFSNNAIMSEKMKEKLPLAVNFLEPGGTSTICAYQCAKYMGFKNIIFAGIDLAFKDDTAYCNGDIVVTTGANTAKIGNGILQLTKVKSITGKYIDTREDYALFVKQFEMFFAKDKTSNLYNLTTFGAFITGMQYLSLEEILDKTGKETINADKVVQELMDKNSEMPKQIKRAHEEILKEEYKKIQPIVEQTKEWFEMYSEHPNFFDYATKIIVKITSSMILQTYIQIELMKFSKLVLSKDEATKKEIITKILEYVLKYNEDLYNLI